MSGASDACKSFWDLRKLQIKDNQKFKVELFTIFNTFHEFSDNRGNQTEIYICLLCYFFGFYNESS